MLQEYILSEQTCVRVMSSLRIMQVIYYCYALA